MIDSYAQLCNLNYFINYEVYITSICNKINYNLIAILTRTCIIGRRCPPPISAAIVLINLCVNFLSHNIRYHEAETWDPLHFA